MCGRFTLTSTPETLAERFELEPSGEPFVFEPAYNIAPGRDVVALRAPEGRRSGSLLRWGLVPHWARDAAIGNRMINARMETAGEKPAFRDALRRRRCVMPADGFYEWAPAAQGRQPHYIHRRDRALFGIAGLWERWHTPEGGTLESCTVLTRPAESPVSELHDRMPVIVDDEMLLHWLDPEQQDAGEVLALISAPAPAPLDAHPVSDKVNQPAWNVPECLLPVPAAPQQPGLFS